MPHTVHPSRHPSRHPSATRRHGPLAGLALATLLAVAVPSSAEAGENKLIIGLGAEYGPVFPGSSKSGVDPVPFVNARWNALFVDRRGLGVDLSRDVGALSYRFGLALGLGEGRDDNDDNRIRGLGDVDRSIEAKGFVEVEIADLTVGLTIAQDVGSGHEGRYVDLEVEQSFDLTPSLELSVGPRLRWADRRYSKAFFGVDAGQSRRSGLARHTAGGGFVGAELEAGLRYSISDRWSTNVSVGVGRLMGDAASSPVSKSDTYLTLATGVAYRF